MNILTLDGAYFDAALTRLGHCVLNAGPADPAGRTGRIAVAGESGGPAESAGTGALFFDHPVGALELFETAKARGFIPDAVLWCDMCRPPMVVGLEALPAPTLGYSIDQYVNPWHVPYSAAFDAFFVAQKDYLPLFDRPDLMRPAAWLPLFCDPDENALTPFTARDVPVSFVGTLDGPLNPGRAPFIAAFGAQRPLLQARGDYRPVYARSRIVLNQSAAGELNFRLFEAAAQGAAVLTEDVDNGLRDLFLPGENVLPPYPRGDAAAAAAIAGFYLKNPDRLAQIAQAGRDLVVTRHTATARAEALALAAASLIERRSWRARLARRSQVRAETAKCYVFLATDSDLPLPDDHRQTYLNLARAYLEG